MMNPCVSGYTLTRVVAIDKDADDNGRVSYVITAGNEEGKFAVGYDSGIVTLMKPITRDTEIEITANDHGTPARRATLNLTVVMALGQTSGPPHLLMPSPVAKISEDLAVGSTVLDVADRAINADQGSFK